MNQQPYSSGFRQPEPIANGDHGFAQPRPNGRQSDQQESNQSRAARFEDEKKRIIEACFSKRDPEGMQLESYITHVRILEDASYPSSPPPPDSPPSNKKHRVILVAVRRSGKVRVHKARENPNGSFSIGKTWNLDELTAIISYSSLIPANPQQQMEKQWASGTGFTVSLGKPYFWAAATAKEKDFFIASLIKIYRKYTGGKVPELIGFAPQEIQQLTGIPSTQNTPTSKIAFSPIVPSPTPPTPAQQFSTTSPSVPAISANRPQSPYAAVQPPASRDGPRIDPQEQPRGFGRQEYRPPTREAVRPPSSQAEERAPGLPPRPNHRVPPQEDPRSQPYGAHLRQEDARKPSTPESLQPPPLRPSASPKGPQMKPPTAEPALEPPPLRPNGLGTPKGGSQDFSMRRTGPSAGQDPFANSRDSGRAETLSNSRPSTATSDRKTAEPPPSLPALDFGLYPEPKKPPTTAALHVDQKVEQRGPPSQANSTFETPLGTPSGMREDEQQKKPDYFANEKAVRENNVSQANVPIAPGSVSGSATTNEPESLKSANEAASTEAGEAPAPPKTEEEYRPGLGPMVKKRSGKDIANQFRKAALAAGAFQPRQGGAGARLKAMQEKLSNEPDGVTSVVPAPLKRGMSGDSARSGTPDLPTPNIEKGLPTPKVPAKDAVPRVQIERSATSESVTPPVTRATKPAYDGPNGFDSTHEDDRPPVPEKPRSDSPQRRRRQRLEAEVEKHCGGLGIDTILTDEVGLDLDELMTELDWDGKFGGDESVEKYENDIRREIGRAQASGWLGHVQESKVLELASSFDKVIAECDKLDGLLTVYGHEMETLHEAMPIILGFL